MKRFIAVSIVVLAWTLTIGCFGHAPPSPLVDAERFPTPAENTITFWGHSTCYIDVGGTGIVTDPVLVKSYSPWHRRQVPAPPMSSYANTSYVLISHAHRDHLSPKTLKQFPKSVTVLCAEPSAQIVEDLGLSVQIMQPGDSITFPGGSIIAVTAHHPGARNSLKARHDGRALGFIIRTGGRTLYYSGDTEYFDGLTTIGKTYRPDIALLNVNGHLPAVDAFRAFQVLGSPTVIPIHSEAYSGPAAGKNTRFRNEITEMLGGLCVPLSIGESYMICDSDL